MRRSRRRCLSLTVRHALAVAALLSAPRPAAAAPGDLDLSFGAGAGWMTLHEGYYGARGMTVQPDGKIVLAGSERTISPLTVQELVVWRLHPDGSPDTTFNGTGHTVTAIPPSLESSGAAVAVQSDGRIVVAGSSWEPMVIGGPPAPTPMYSLAGFLPDGRPDPAFGPNGQGYFRSTIPGDFLAVALQTDGKILAGGSHWLNGSVLWRFLASGVPDPSFGGGDGWTYIYDGAIQSIAVQSDGKIVLGNADASFAISRYLPDGAPDSTFGVNGYARLPLVYPQTAWCQDVTILPDGKILAGGHFEDYYPGGSVTGFITARYLPTGAPDPGFGDPGGGGSARLAFEGGVYVNTTAMQVQSDGRILLAGYVLNYPGALPPWESGFALARFTAGGPADETFGTGGRVVTVFPGYDNRCYAAALLTDQKLLAAGYVQFQENSSASGIRLARYHVEPTALEIWRVTWFSNPDNSGPGADLNDFDDDGLPNFMEYATLTHPHIYSPDPCHPAGEGAFTYTRPSAALTEFSYQPEAALAPGGPWSATGLTSTVLSDDGTVQTVRIAPAVSPAPPRMFLRLRVTRL
jgi:uncharacterized delta-60 repeat protein